MPEKVFRPLRKHAHKIMRSLTWVIEYLQMEFQDGLLWQGQTAAEIQLSTDLVCWRHMGSMEFPGG
jgi:hypothetical protein